VPHVSICSQKEEKNKERKEERKEGRKKERKKKTKQQNLKTPSGYTGLTHM